MNRGQITPKQRELFEFIKQFIQEHGYSPSYREIATMLGYNSVATVAEHINNLVTLGLIRKTNHSARSLEIVLDDQPSLDLIDQLKLRYRQLDPLEQQKVSQALEILDIELLKQITGWFFSKNRYNKHTFRHSSVVERLAVNQ